MPDLVSYLATIHTWSSPIGGADLFFKSPSHNHAALVLRSLYVSFFWIIDGQAEYYWTSIRRRNAWISRFISLTLIFVCTKFHSFEIKTFSYIYYESIKYSKVIYWLQAVPNLYFRNLQWYATFYYILYYCSMDERGKYRYCNYYLFCCGEGFLFP